MSIYLHFPSHTLLCCGNHQSTLQQYFESQYVLESMENNISSMIMIMVLVMMCHCKLRNCQQNIITTQFWIFLQLYNVLKILYHIVILTKLFIPLVLFSYYFYYYTIQFSKSTMMQKSHRSKTHTFSYF